jgi:hypothetical protein
VKAGTILLYTSILLISQQTLSSWNFDGQRTVQFDLPIQVRGKSYNSISLLGAGASAAVFRLTTAEDGTGTTTSSLFSSSSSTTTTDGSAIALKVSWNDATGNVVRRECDTLLELAGVPHVPRCLALLPYPSSSLSSLNGGEEETTTTSAKTRTMMALAPVVDDVVASLNDLADPQQAVNQIVETTVAMLRRGVYIVDVQWLFTSNDNSSSVVTFIDFTERTDDPVAFLTEVVAGIPTRWRSAARLALRQQQTITATMKGGDTSEKMPSGPSSTTTSNDDVDRAKFDETMEIFAALLADE